MVLSFFKKNDSGLELISHRTIKMLADARHSFDLASAAVLSGADYDSVAEDIRVTDNHINKTEQDLRGDLVTHIAVHGGSDIGVVLSYTLLIKKIGYCFPEASCLLLRNLFTKKETTIAITKLQATIENPSLNIG